jgi:hypothetical protein
MNNTAFFRTVMRCLYSKLLRIMLQLRYHNRKALS